MAFLALPVAGILSSLLFKSHIEGEFERGQLEKHCKDLDQAFKNIGNNLELLNNQAGRMDEKLLKLEQQQKDCMQRLDSQPKQAEQQRNELQANLEQRIRKIEEKLTQQQRQDVARLEGQQQQAERKRQELQTKLEQQDKKADELTQQQRQTDEKLAQQRQDLTQRLESQQQQAEQQHQELQAKLEQQDKKAVELTQQQRQAEEKLAQQKKENIALQEGQKQQARQTDEKLTQQQRQTEGILAKQQQDFTQHLENQRKQSEHQHQVSEARFKQQVKIALDQHQQTHARLDLQKQELMQALEDQRKQAGKNLARQQLHARRLEKQCQELQAKLDHQTKMADEKLAQQQQAEAKAEEQQQYFTRRLENQQEQSAQQHLALKAELEHQKKTADEKLAQQREQAEMNLKHQQQEFSLRLSDQQRRIDRLEHQQQEIMKEFQSQIKTLIEKHAASLQPALNVRNPPHEQVDQAWQKCEAQKKQMDQVLKKYTNQLEHTLHDMMKSEQRDSKHPTANEKTIATAVLAKLSEQEETLTMQQTTPALLDAELRALNEAKSKLEVELEGLRSGAKHDSADQRRLAELEKYMQPLKEEYEERQQKITEQQKILDIPRLKIFYNRVQVKLNQFFIAYMVLASDQVDMKAGGIGEKALKFFGEKLDTLTMGLSVPVTSGISAVHGRKKKKAITEIAQNFIISITATEEIVEYVARQLALRYEAQIRELTLPASNPSLLRRVIYSVAPDGGVETLAECAVVRMISALKQGDIKADSAFDEQLIDSVFTSENYQGFFPFTHKDVATTGNKDWTDNGVFQHSGIKVRDEKTQAVTCFGRTTDNNSKKKSDCCHKHPKYGFRWGNIDEVKRLDLGIIRVIPPPPPPPTRPTEAATSHALAQGTFWNKQCQPGEKKHIQNNADNPKVSDAPSAYQGPLRLTPAAKNDPSLPNVPAAAQKHPGDITYDPSQSPPIRPPRPAPEAAARARIG
jgi:hypothetical protein